MILAIDPGNEKSGWATIVKNSYYPFGVGKIRNEELVEWESHLFTEVIIEMVGHYGTGMPAGRTVFDTCVWIGRFMQHFKDSGVEVHLMMRSDVKMNLCGNVRARDSNIRQALIDRFAHGASNYGKGTKKAPGWFYGFSADMWQAYALGVTYLDLGVKE